MSNEVAWYLTSLTRLIHLNVADCPRLDDACLPAIWALTALTRLSLSSTGVAGLPGMSLPNGVACLSFIYQPVRADEGLALAAPMESNKSARMGCPCFKFPYMYVARSLLPQHLQIQGFAAHLHLELCICCCPFSKQKFLGPCDDCCMFQLRPAWSLHNASLPCIAGLQIFDIRLRIHGCWGSAVNTASFKMPCCNCRYGHA